MDHEQLLSFLTDVEQQGVALLHQKGYQWFKSTFLPHLRLADELLPNQAELIADCWYLAADVYDFNNAPVKAIEYYQKALEYDDLLSGAYREIAHMNLQIGQYKEALRYAELSLEQHPDDQDMLDEKAKIIDHINYNHQAYYLQDNLAWQYSEWLAAEQFETLTDHYETHKNNDTSLMRAYAAALGGLNKPQQCLATWQALTASKQDFVLDYFDWFYLPDALFKGRDFWLLMQEASPCLKEADYLFCDSLIDNYMPSLNEVSLLDLIAQWKISHLDKDQKKLDALAQKYPLWIL